MNDATHPTQCPTAISDFFSPNFNYVVKSVKISYQIMTFAFSNPITAFK